MAARLDRNHQVVWRSARPHFAITVIGGSSRNCYHETLYEIVSEVELDANDLKRLDECGLLGMGQDYYLRSSEQFTEAVGPSVIDARTGALVPDALPLSAIGTLLTNTYDYTYYRYTVKRVCDSGD